MHVILAGSIADFPCYFWLPSSGACARPNSAGTPSALVAPVPRAARKRHTAMLRGHSG